MENRETLQELPVFIFRGGLAAFVKNKPILTSRKSLEKLSGLYDLNLFRLNTKIDNSCINESALQQLQSCYYSPHSFELLKNRSLNHPDDLSIFHNNIRSLNLNLENLQIQVFMN